MKAIVNYIPNLNLILEYKTSISNSIKKNSIDRPGFSKILNFDFILHNIKLLITIKELKLSIRIIDTHIINDKYNDTIRYQI